MTAGRSRPVSTPISWNMLTRSSVAILPVEPAGTGQPPSSPKLASKLVQPASSAAYALARPCPRVLWKCAVTSTPGRRSMAAAKNRDAYAVQTPLAVDREAGARTRDRVGRGQQRRVLALEGGGARPGADRGHGEHGRQPGRGRSARAGEQLGRERQLDEPAALTAEGLRHADPGPSVTDQPPGELGRVAGIEPAAHHFAGGHVGEPGAERLPVGLLLLGQLPPHP